MAWRIAVLVAATILLAWLSRASLRNPASHGFHRFFAWEAIIALFLLNVSHWFETPLAWHQIIAWLLLFVCLVPVISGTVALRRHGRPVAARAGEEGLLAFEKTSRLVTTGIYAYIRHPLYASLMLLAWGIFFKRPSVAGGALAVVATGFLVLTARADEAECCRFFGAEYEAYMVRTRRFVPFVV